MVSRYDATDPSNRTSCYLQFRAMCASNAPAVQQLINNFKGKREVSSPMPFVSHASLNAEKTFRIKIRLNKSNISYLSGPCRPLRHSATLRVSYPP